MTLYTAKVVADWIRLTERRVRQLRDQGVIREERPGLYDLKASVGEYIEYLRGSGKEGLTAERTRLTAERRKAAEMDNAERAGGLHRTGDVEAAIKAAVLHARARLLAMPAKTAGRLAQMGGDRAGIPGLLSREVNEALEELGSLRAESTGNAGSGEGGTADGGSKDDPA